MIAVIFEVEPTADGKSIYLDLAGELRPLLDDIDGFISIERFVSLSDPSKILSLSFWRDEEAVAQWRNLSAHRDAQRAGRAGVFENYRLRIARVVRDYGLYDRAQAPGDSRSVHSDSRSIHEPQ
jgi:heme-degrading monooxygenase HmoA